jgi:hypothetical protein
MKRSAGITALVLTVYALTTTSATSASPQRLPPEIERLIQAVDLDGFSAGKCLALLPDPEKARIEAGRHKFDQRPSETTRPLFDQVYYGAIGRGLADAERQTPDAEVCDMLRSNAAESLAEKAAAIAAFEGSLPKELQRDGGH